MTYKNTSISLLMIAVVGFAIWTLLLSFRTGTALTQTAMLPDAFMEDVTAVFMDKQGRPNIKIITPKLIHYTENDTTHLTQPHLTLYRKSPTPWYIASKYAKATHGIDNVNFWEDVTIHHVADENNPATLIKTLTLTVHPNEQTAETTDLITLVQPNITVNATGMQADLKSGNIKLLSQSKGEYAPNS